MSLGLFCPQLEFYLFPSPVIHVLVFGVVPEPRFEAVTHPILVPWGKRTFLISRLGCGKTWLSNWSVEERLPAIVLALGPALPATAQPWPRWVTFSVLWVCRTVACIHPPQGAGQVILWPLQLVLNYRLFGIVWGHQFLPSGRIIVWSCVQDSGERENQSVSKAVVKLTSYMETPFLVSYSWIWVVITLLLF